MRWWPLLLFAACEASPHVHIRVVMPPGTAVTRDRLHVDADSSSTEAFKPTLSEALVISEKIESNTVDVELGLGIGGVKYVYIRAWYDTNGSGTLDAGDLQGDMTPAPFESRDPGGCAARDANRAPSIILKPV